MAELARATTGRADVLVNVAGFFPVQPFLEMSAADWRKIIDINLTGTALMCQAMLPLMTGRGWAKTTAIAVRCLKREERAEDLTGAVFFLASPDADFLTGQTIVVDGGNEML